MRFLEIGEADTKKCAISSLPFTTRTPAAFPSSTSSSPFCFFSPLFSFTIFSTRTLLRISHLVSASKARYYYYYLTLDRVGLWTRVPDTTRARAIMCERREQKKKNQRKTNIIINTTLRLVRKSKNTTQTYTRAHVQSRYTMRIEEQ